MTKEDVTAALVDAVQAYAILKPLAGAHEAGNLTEAAKNVAALLVNPSPGSAAVSVFPTFAEWHYARHGRTFEQRMCAWTISDAMQQLSRELQIYVTEMVASIRPSAS